MAVEGIGALARGQDGERATEAGGTDNWSCPGDPSHKRIAVAMVGELQIFDVDDSGIGHVRCPRCIRLRYLHNAHG
jgi:hypothetical protein